MSHHPVRNLARPEFKPQPVGRYQIRVGSRWVWVTRYESAEQAAARCGVPDPPPPAIPRAPRAAATGQGRGLVRSL